MQTKILNNMRNNIWIITLLLVMAACGKEDSITPIAEKNWLVLEEPAADAPAHDKAIYSFYKETGIPIYYNDTIGKETRVSHGQEVTYYETLKIAYTLEGYSFYMEFDFYTKEEIATLPVDEFIHLIKSEILASIPSNISIPSILICKRLYENTNFAAYWGFKTIGIVLPRTIDDNLGGMILAAIAKQFVIDQDSKALQTFYDLTNTTFRESPYGKDYWTLELDEYSLGREATVEDLYQFGFIEDIPGGWEQFAPSQSQDTEMYLRAIFTKSLAEFSAEFVDYPICIKKFELMQEIAASLGFKL
jgi:lipoprotein